MNRSSSSDLEKDGKRSREEDGHATERLSHLPEPIIHHILSFLETKWAVRTSVLSRFWRCAWKHVPVLKLYSNSFQQYSSFERFVENILSLRHPFTVRSMTYAVNDELELEEEDDEEEEEFVKVIKYALSHGIQHLTFSLFYIVDVQDTYGFSDLFGTISNCNLKTLDLFGVHIDGGFGSSGFSMLTTLELGQCLLASDQDGDFDPFSNFPCLKKLVLAHCKHLDSEVPGHERRLKIYGPQLLSLELELVWSSHMEIVAPRLKFLCLEHDLENLKFSNLSFPALDHAYIHIYDDFHFMEGNKECATKGSISLLQALSNVTSIKLHSCTIEVLFWFILLL
ncbi:unnamed protein product [Linum tenue]|uniref:F-box domain-containing protein n=1 Tax=Linum tenue TaxID=586396 RepID=A0AAV0Q3Y3_9ROSI|nr:unnamed protein product [Linum tenue]